MRLLIGLLIAFIATVGLGIWVDHRLDSDTEALLQHVEQIHQEVEQDQWQSASTDTSDLQEKWSTQAKWWNMVMLHQEIDNIEFALARVQEYVASQNRALSLGQLSELRLMLKHIPEKEAISLKNIL
ncbi:DUF4363 family protein [Heliophilum fasciatum]|uniref:Uncharacterized protein DUF4363 n=1 Tax=Heliophilum fasciatum TaxID=35700 RepID=A0A4R2RLK0_9FIRM|nr:DUF4363 family protein [Heliophilum fasciatum]MCW2279392.1 hypothetical protein [Heliophilum fasciatum]TCP60095.1 uncharacterized protein DUF4363 [Heliophilum fasciatum]